ncbi:MAG: hypothetical protein JSS62_03590 [Verrucomicrobia bacterium]|nr:hypothetical protein [Verrucomicrobiota bacterium]MBS0645080.1 hypothetical protein [Verrucomicrobiota bacterium]
MSIASQITSVLGFHSPLSYQDSTSALVHDQKGNSDAEIAEAQAALHFNSIHIAGYIPILGMASAIIRIGKVCDLSDSKNNLIFAKIALVIRAIFEFFGGGLVLLIPDLLVSCYRLNWLQSLSCSCPITRST